MHLSRTVVVSALALLAGLGVAPDEAARGAAAQTAGPVVCHWSGSLSRPADRLSTNQHVITLRVERDLGGGGAAGSEETLVLNSTYGATYYRGIDLRPGMLLEARGYRRVGGQCVVDTLNVGTLEPGFEGFLRPGGICPTAGEETIAVSDAASLALGCAASPVVAAPTGIQRFAGGVMIHLNGIYTLQYGPAELGDARRGGGIWSGIRDTYREPEPAQLGLAAPPGLTEPRLGFGKAWRESYDGPAGPLGWATEPERTESGAWQLFDGGIVAVTASGESFILYYHEGRIWEQRHR